MKVRRSALARLEPIATLVAVDGVRFEPDPATVPEWRVFAERESLRQIFSNLLSNAVKYNRPGGLVAVAYEPVSETRLRIKVIDTGRSIPADKMQRFFTPFDRLGTEHTGVDGTGFGLTLSKQLAEAMGG